MKCEKVCEEFAASGKACGVACERSKRKTAAAMTTASSQRMLKDLMHDTPLPDALVGRPTMGWGVPAKKPKTVPDWADAEAVAMERELGKYVRYWPQVRAIAGMSKYPGTKVGALILGARFEPLSSGWNGAPRGSDADEDGRLVDRSSRLLWACHAEANAIANAAAVGTPLLGGTMLVSLMPCMACAKLVVQSGIRRVITQKPDAETAERWRADFDATRQLFAEVGVELNEIDIPGE